MKAKFVRGQDSKRSLNVGMEKFRRPIRITYDPYDTVLAEDKKRVKSLGLTIIKALKGIDPILQIEQHEIYEKESTYSIPTQKKLYGVIYAKIATKISNYAIEKYLRDIKYGSSLLDNLFYINVNNDLTE